jgi:hypothetical protein
MKILASHDVSAIECAAFAANSGDIGTAVNAALSGRHNDEVCLLLRGKFFFRNTENLSQMETQNCLH